MKKLAVICNYELQEDRVGGMDYFFWAFDKKCKENSIEVDWFFPNMASHEGYAELHIIPAENSSLEQHFLNHLKQHSMQYTHLITHFLELCTSFFQKIKWQLPDSYVIAVDHNPRPLKGYPFKKKLSKKIKGVLYSRYIDQFVAVSEYSKQNIIQDFGNHLNVKTEVIFNGLMVEKFKKKTSFGNLNRFIVACHLRKDKGIQDLLLAIKDFQEYFFQIDIYGKGYFETELKAMVKRYSLHDKVKFKGSVSNLHELYCEYDYLIHPSHGETFCYTVVESLLSNLPVLTTKNQGNVLRLVEENVNGFLFDEADVEGLKSILKSILKGEKVIDSDFNSVDNRFEFHTMVNSYFKIISIN